MTIQSWCCRVFRSGGPRHRLDGDSALYYAASKGRVSAVALLLTLGANADANPGGRSPLTVAAHLASPLGQRPAHVSSSDYANIAVKLLGAGADPTAMYGTGLALSRETRQGVEIAPLDRVRQAVAINADWTVIYMTPSGRTKFQ